MDPGEWLEGGRGGGARAAATIPFLLIPTRDENERITECAINFVLLTCLP